MKILLAHAFSKRNLGDAAICSSMIAEINRVFPSSEISMSILDNVDNETFFGTKQHESCFYYAIYTSSGTLSRMARTLYMLTATTLWAIAKRAFNVSLDIILAAPLKEALHEISEASLVVPVGGGYLNGKKGLHQSLILLLSLHEIILPVILKKPTVLYSQSIGPFGNMFQRYIAKVVLNRTDAIFVREKISQKLLVELGVKSPEIYLTTDSGFLFESDTKDQMKNMLRNIGVDFSSTVVGVTVRNWLSPENQDHFETEMAIFLDRLIDKHDAQVIIIPQVTTRTHNEDDREVGRRVYEKMHNQSRAKFLNQEFDHFEIKGIYDNLDYLVGTRMHSVIFSLTSHVPCLAIEYEYKTRGIMNDLGLGDWVIKIDEVNSSTISRMFDELVLRQDSFQTLLSSSLKDYISKARQAPLKLREIFARTVDQPNQETIV